MNHGGPRSLAWRLGMAYLLTTLAIVLALGAAVYLYTAYTVHGRLEAELDAQADFYAAYAAQLAGSEGELAGLAATLVDLFAAQADLNVRVFAAGDGVLLAATQDIGPQPSRAALAALRYRSPAVFTQRSRDMPGRRYAAQEVIAGGRTIGVVEVSRSTQANERTLAALRRILLLAVAVAAALSLLVSALLARRLSRPIRDMEWATRRIAAGDLDVRLEDYPPDELGRLAGSINDMAGQLKRLEDARAQFIGEIAHDLRTPLTALKGLLVNLIDASGTGDAPPVEGRPSLQLAERETDRLIRLVNQLLDLARWQAGRLALNRRSVDLCAIARAALALNGERADHRRLDLRADLPAGPLPVYVDPDRLERVLFNLLDNAIRFTPGGGQVVLSVRRGKDSALSADQSPASKGKVEVSVRDTGRGMSEEERLRAFEPYYRGEGGGTGLGLTIARAIVEAHGGQMGIESPTDRERGGGTRVWFTLPL